ncbi:MAG: DNA polymerase III subunit gamma/tau [Desulfuromonadales bacterium]|nr:DNA polymerase III subunit gamma/tau [Desulfuromonadales bacterium]
MSYLVLARKWRPQTFSDLIGQEHVAQTLKNAIESGRIAHAFLFTGARGVGKTSSARILAKALNCETGMTTEPCNVCQTCIEITNGTSVDVFEIDGASNTGVDDIRELRDNVKYLPSSSRYKIFIIDEVHMLSTSAFNALLKTLEEPPSHVKFIFATTEPHKVPVTILSRCQRFDFKRIPLQLIADRLRYISDQEGITISDTALTMIARKGDGSMRDSLSAMDQVLAFCGETVADEDVVAILGVVDKELLYSTITAVIEKDTKALLEIVKKVDEFGYSMRQFTQDLMEQFRILMIFKATKDITDIVDLSEQEKNELNSFADKFETETIQRHLSILLKSDNEMAHSSFTRLILEMALIKMATLSQVIPVNEILDRIKALGSGDFSSSSVTVAEKKETYSFDFNKAASIKTEAQTPQKASPIETKYQPEKSSNENWISFVSFVNNKKSILGKNLEKGNPLKFDNEGVHIGLKRDSIELSMLQEDYNKELNELVAFYFDKPVPLKIIPLSEDAGNIPLSMAEKKTLELKEEQDNIKEKASNHPLVKAVLEVFGGEMEVYKQH